MAASRIQRWVIVLSSYNYELDIRTGLKHGNANSMHRLPFQNDNVEKDSVLENQALTTELCNFLVTSK